MATQTEQISRVGEYHGYSEPLYDGWVRRSQYVEARDGTRLAVDVYRPTRNGVVEERPLPVAWTAKRYLRATVRDGRLATMADLPHAAAMPAMDSPAARKLSAHGYVLAAADMRGTGASFGNWTECSDPAARTDGYDVNEWLASQPFCDGSVGMFGVSYEGRMQLEVASSGPPSLKAIVPEVSPYDWYTIIHQGGSYSRFFSMFAPRIGAQDRDPSMAPVDDDRDG